MTVTQLYAKVQQQLYDMVYGPGFAASTTIRENASVLTEEEKKILADHHGAPSPRTALDVYMKHEDCLRTLETKLKQARKEVEMLAHQVTATERAARRAWVIVEAAAGRMEER